VGAVIEIENVSKHFRLYHEPVSSFKERFVHFGRRTYDEFWALRDVSLDVAQGETVGLLGHNGSGKSTLLKCVAGTLRPTSGHVRKTGRVAALLELGSGFHPDLTGRENLFLNGSILGLSRRDVAKIFDEVVAFAEIEPFIDNQVKYYSSGMYARLAFALAVNVEPEILLVDEVLSVGDESFQRKCLARIEQFQREGRTILLVTHVADLVRRICDRAAVLDHGHLVALGDPGHSVVVFRDTLLKGGLGVPPEAIGEPERISKVRITRVDVEYPEPLREHLYPGEPLNIAVSFETDAPLDDVVFALTILDQRGTHLLGTNTDVMGCSIDSIGTSGKVVFQIEHVPLLDGVYAIGIGCHTHDGGTIFADRAERDYFAVANSTRSEGLVYFPIRARLEDPDRVRGA
jgi:ABC-type polysaccharide/polyol phosphate transport system ATPase subunit